MVGGEVYHTTTLDFDHCLTRDSVFWLNVIHILGSHEGSIGFGSERFYFFLVFIMAKHLGVVGYFEVTIFTKGVLVPVESLRSFFWIDVFEGLSYFTCKRGDDTNEVFFEFCQKFVVDTWTIVEAFSIGFGDELDEVLVPFKGFSQKD